MTDLPAEDVQSYPRPPALETVPQEVVVVLGGQEIVRTTSALRVLETHHAPTYYLPPDAIAAEMLPVPGGSHCEWKGRAAYWTLRAGGATAPRAAWSYARPTARFAALRDHLAIYAHAMEGITVGGVAVTPQPGDFYGGWVTPNLTGIVKGGPGTEGW
ncbi:MAG: DUF427 domain-containing protein [Shimia sp.]